MCDTLVVPASASADGVTIFAKNSDRHPNEGHHLLRVPAADHPAGSQVKCTYLEIPQVAHTHEVLLAKPFWIWGAEMGANEHGVAIGNEAVFTKIPYDKTPGLIGMDILRLALERARTARQALDVMIALLEQYGQGGSCAADHGLYYHNSYLIADPSDAWVFETADVQWAAQQVRDVRTISNGLTIGSEWDLASAGLVDFAVRRGWCKGRQDFHFARCYSDFLFTRFSASKARQCRTTDLLTAQRGRLTPTLVMQVLRDHGAQAGADWSPEVGLDTVSVCWHAGYGPIRTSQSAGSLVSHLAPGRQTHFATATSAPCTSIFKPLWLGADLPDTGPVPGAVYDPDSLFWKHERLHRATLKAFPARLELYRQERDALEARLVQEAFERRDRPSKEWAAFSAGCFVRAEQAESGWLARLSGSPARKHRRFFYDLAWRSYDRQAGMPELP
jgi:secernin